MKNQAPPSANSSAAFARVVARLDRIEKKIDNSRRCRGPASLPAAHRNEPVVDLSERPCEPLNAGLIRTLAIGG